MEQLQVLSETFTLTRIPALGLLWGITETQGGVLVVSDAERHTICTLENYGTSLAQVIAGSGYAGFADGIGEKAMFNTPKGLSIGAHGEILICDSGNHRLRQVSPNGIVSVISGSSKRGHTDGPVKTATWELPVDILRVKNSKTYLITELSSPHLRFLKNGNVSTIFTKEIHFKVSLIQEQSLQGVNQAAIDAERPTNTIRTIILPPEVRSPIFNYNFEEPSSENLVEDHSARNTTTEAKNLKSILGSLDERLTFGERGFIDRPIGNSCFKSINSIVTNKRGDIILLDNVNHALRHVSVEGMVTTLAGNGLPGHVDGKSSLSRLSHPRSLHLSKNGDLYISDTGNYCLRRVVLPTSMRHLWIKSAKSKSAEIINNPKHFYWTMPTVGERAIIGEIRSKFSDLVWETKYGGVWSLHKAIIYSRCPSLQQDSSLSKFLDRTGCNPTGYKLFFDFIYNDVFPVPRYDVESLSSLAEFLSLLECAELSVAVTYTTWLMSKLMNEFGIEELKNCVLVLDKLGLWEPIRTCVTMMMSKAHEIMGDQANGLLTKVMVNIKNPELHAWLKKKLLSPSSSKSYLKKVPKSPFGEWSKHFGALILRDSKNERLSFLSPPDLVIRLNVDQLSCHRVFLYKRWPLITDFLETNAKESEEMLVFDVPDAIGDMRISSLYGLLWYFYTSSLDKLKGSEDCTELIQLYEHLKLDDIHIKEHLNANGFLLLTDATGAQIPASPSSSYCSIQ